MIKGFRQIASLTAISRVLGMLRDMAFAYFLGSFPFISAKAVRWIDSNSVIDIPSLIVTPFLQFLPFGFVISR